MWSGEPERQMSRRTMVRRRPFPLTRRTFFALAGGAVLGACGGDPRSSATPPASSGLSTLPVTTRKVFYGAATPPDRLDSFEARLGSTLSCYRSFFEAGSEAELVTQAGNDIHAGRAPLVSIKPPGSWAATAANTSWLDALVEPLSRLPGPVFLIVHHEPEDDTATYGTPADYVAMQDAALARAAMAGNNIRVVPVLSSWSFNPSSSREPQEWNVERAAIYGLDLYNPWSPTNGKPWQPFSERLALAEHEAAGRPILVGEYGCRTDPAQPGRAAGWMQDAFDDAVHGNVVAMAYFNSNRNTRDGTWELDAETFPVFSQLLQSKDVAHIRTARHPPTPSSHRNSSGPAPSTRRTGNRPANSASNGT